MRKALVLLFVLVVLGVYAGNTDEPVNVCGDCLEHMEKAIVNGDREAFQKEMNRFEYHYRFVNRGEDREMLMNRIEKMEMLCENAPEWAKMEVRRFRERIEGMEPGEGQHKLQFRREVKEGFVDEDGDGICDKYQVRERKHYRLKKKECDGECHLENQFRHRERKQNHKLIHDHMGRP